MQVTVNEYQKREKIQVLKLLDLEARSMRDNFVFTGLDEPQKPKAGVRPTPDNCEQLIKTLMLDTLGIETKDTEFNIVHRLGGIGPKIKPLPIIVNFHPHADREKVRLT